MAQVIWTEPALSDLDEIADYIALDNVSAAKRLVQKIFSIIERLEKHPKSGRTPPELKRSRYREVIVGPCRIFYRGDHDKAYILYVVRGERELRKYLIDDRAQKKQLMYSESGRDLRIDMRLARLFERSITTGFVFRYLTLYVLYVTGSASFSINKIKSELTEKRWRKAINQFEKGLYIVKYT